MSKNTVSQWALSLFFANAVANLIAQVLDIWWLDWITKPLIMGTLLTYYLSRSDFKKSRYSNLLVAAMVFSWVGDVVLMIHSKQQYLFIVGLASFLVAHLFYIFTFAGAVKPAFSDDSKHFLRTRIAFLIFVGLALLYVLYPVLDEMLVSVVLYTSVIIVMAITAARRKGRTVESSFVMVYSGAILFIMSDSMLAVNKFLNPFFQASTVIMATYIAAQFLIVKGIATHENL
jgi:uncharacterized membrane protein YhhN